MSKNLKSRKYRWAYTSKGTPIQVRTDEIDNAIDKYSRKEWETSNSPAWQEVAQKGQWERLRFAIKNEVKGYMEVNPGMTADEAVRALRRSRIYKSQQEFYQTEMYYKLAKHDWNRENGKFALKKANIKYEGKVEINNNSYSKYKITMNSGKVWWVYEADSPKQETYEFTRTQEEDVL